MEWGDNLSSERDAQVAKLTALERHLLDNRKIVERQRAHVHALHSQGRAAGQSLILLAKLERTLAAFEREFEDLQTEISEHAKSD